MNFLQFSIIYTYEREIAETNAKTSNLDRDLKRAKCNDRFGLVMQNLPYFFVIDFFIFQ